ncbi:Holliday junction endonuclease [Streptomyces sp. NPDC051320]|uniref:Holliday junction endonuclease n=1 Tax=Streptomyces sp. NPDC051320 TaxID=3154644 RepID=UPI003429D768
MRAPQVVGLDLSITATGIAYRDGSTGTVGGPSDLGDRRLLVIEQNVAIAIGGEDIGPGRLPDLVVIEDLPTHAKSAGITGMVHGAVRAVLLRRDVLYAVITPATLKAYATGKGNADKTAMAMAAYKRTGLEFADDNQCDAAWLRWAGLDRLGWPQFTLPAAQRDRLNKAKWPALKEATS